MPDPLRILLIDDNPNDRTLILHQLQQAFADLQARQVTGAEELASALDQGGFDLVITDYRLHWSDGLTTLRRVKERWPDCPVIMCTDSGNEEVAVEAMKAGLDDYVLKSSRHLQRLPRAVQGALERARQRRLLQEREEEERLRSRVYECLAQRQPGKALDQAFALLPTLLPVDGIGLLIWRQGQKSFRGQKQWVHPEAEKSSQLMFQEIYGQGTPGEMPLGVGSYADIVLETGQPLYIPDLSQSPYWGDTIRARHGWRTTALYPLILREDFKALLIMQSRRVDAFTEREHRLCQTLCPTLAAAVEAWRYETELQVLSTRLETVLYHLPEGVCVLDADHRLLLTNPRAQAYLEVLGAGDDEGRLTRLGDRSLEELLIPPPPDQRYHEVRVTSPTRIFEVMSQPIETGPERGGWVLLLQDVTQERVRQERIRQQERLATVGQLAAGIAHDFNNILNVIIGFSDLLLQDPTVSPAARSKLSLIAQQGKRASHLVRQILDFSRRSIAERRPLDLLPFLKEQVKLLQRTLPETIHLSFSWTPGEYLIEADPTQLQQILTNLAVNARDAMPEGGELRIHLSRLCLQEGDPFPFPQMPAGEWVVVTVTDTGVGIPAEVLPHVFEPFFTTKAPGQGTGLGLAQVYGLVKQHQGWIDVSSRLGEGTTFTLYFPALELVQESAPREATPEALPQGQGEMVLVVEDDDMVLRVTETMLTHLGYRVVAARNGEEALQVLAQHREEIRLVLTDLVMPGRGGTALCQIVHRQDPTLPILVMSGYPLGEERQALQTEGVVGWLPKPLSMEQVARAVHQVLQRRR